MIRLFRAVFEVLFSCHSYTKRTSVLMDRPLSASERVKRNIHHFICQRCRVAASQLQEVERGMSELLKDGAQDVEELKLPKDFAARLKDKIPKQ